MLHDPLWQRCVPLQSEQFSYLFRITKQGLPEHIHFGSPVTLEDVQALACKPGSGWGSSVLYSQEDNVCLDSLPLEWSGNGRGDYRESPVILKKNGRACFCICITPCLQVRSPAVPSWKTGVKHR